jgi:adenine-specific DNA-methyltransferase
VIKYIGSKRLLVPRILELVQAEPGVRTVTDLFSGTARVGHALKAAGYRVRANDHNAYAATLARCYVQADAETWAAPAERLLAELRALPGRPGWFTESFCVQSRYIQPHNGARIDAVRQAIADKGLPPELEAVLLVSLMEAADRVDSTTGVQMAYLKQWSSRSHRDLELRMPALLPRAAAGPGEAHARDALEAVGELDADLLYLDPPYNQHKYIGNYHVWESLVRWDQPELFGVARKRVDCRTRPSDFNSRPRALPALAQLVRASRAKVIIVSFNDEGHIARPDIEALLAERGPVEVVEQAFDRYVGARIGIYSPSGEKVGRVGRLRNTEYLYRVRVEGA